MATTAGNFTTASAKFNTVEVYHGMYCGTLLNTEVYRGTLFFMVPSPGYLYFTLLHYYTSYVVNAKDINDFKLKLEP